MATIGRLVVQIGADVGGLTAGLQTAQSKLKGFGSQMKSIGTGMSMGITAPIVGIGAVALKSAGEFEQSMNLMQTMSGATGGEMAALQAQALELGAVTTFSAGDAATAMLELSKAGMSVAEVTAAVPGVLNLAAAGGIGLADAATITANAVNSFGLEAGAAATVANTFAAAANASSADVMTLADGFKNAGAVFSSNGQTVSDLATGLSILSNNGIDGAEAGTQLKVMMQRLAAPTDEARRTLTDLGVSVYDSTGKMDSFETIIGQLSGGLDGLSDSQRNAALSAIFGTHAINAATILAAEGAQGFTDMQAAVEKSGAAAELGESRMKGFGGAIEYFKGTIDSLLIGTALPWLDTLGGMVRGAADLIGGFGKLSPQVQTFGVVLAVALAAAGPLLIVLGTMATALAALMSPIGLAILGIGLLGVAIAANWGAISKVVTRGVKAVQPALDSIMETVNGLRSGDLTFREVGAGMLAELQTLPAKIQGWASSIDWAGLIGQAGDITASIYDKVSGWFTAIDWTGMFSAGVGATSSLASAVGAWLAGIDWAGGASSIQSGITALRDAVSSELATVDWAGGASNMQAGLTALRDTVMANLGSIDWAGAVSSAGGFIQGIEAWRTGLMAQLTSSMAGFNWRAVGKTFTGWVDGLSVLVSSLDLSSIDWSGFLTAGLLGPLSTAMTAVKWAVGPENFATLKGSVMGGLAQIDWAGIADSMFGLASAIGGQVFTMGIDLVDDVSQKINDIDWGALSVDFAGMVSWVAGKIGQIDWAAGAAGIGTATLNLAAAVGGAIREIKWGELLSAGAGLLGSTGQAGMDIGSGLLSAISAKVNSVDWSTVDVDFSAMVANMTQNVAEIDWTGMGVSVGESIRGFFTNLFDTEGDNPFTTLGVSVYNALTTMNWDNIGTALAGFGDVAANAVASFVSGIMTGLGVDMTALQWPEFPDWKEWLPWNDWNAWLSWNAWNDWNDWLDWKPWNPFPEFRWPSLPSWSWPAISKPGWWDTGGGGGGGGGGGMNAVGTPSWPGGLTTVGEFGPELVRLPAGSRIWSNQDSMDMLGAGRSERITIGPNYISDKVDVEALAYRVATINARRGR